jgi:hypothetical protein
MIRRQVPAFLAGVVLLLGTWVPSVAAGGVTELVIGPGGGEIGTGFVTTDGGSTWSLPDGSIVAGCGAAFSEASGSVPASEFRSAIEFPLGQLPDGVVIEWVELHMAAAEPSDATLAIRTYPGDGSIDPADIQVGGTPYPTVFTTAGVREAVYFAEDVSASARSAGWLGFSIRLDPVVPATVTAVCPEGDVSDLGPLLVIGYTQASGSQVPDAAMSAVTDRPVAAIGFGLLLVAGLLAVAMARTQTRRA